MLERPGVCMEAEPVRSALRGWEEGDLFYAKFELEDKKFRIKGQTLQVAGHFIFREIKGDKVACWPADEEAEELLGDPDELIYVPLNKFRTLPCRVDSTLE